MVIMVIVIAVVLKQQTRVHLCNYIMMVLVVVMMVKVVEVVCWAKSK